MRAFIGTIMIGAGLLLNGCSHEPVYPSIGSLYISSDPTAAEILVDGKTASRVTPAKIDGISVGLHKVMLRYYNRKDWNGQAEIKPGQTTRLAVSMQEVQPATIQKYNLSGYNPGSMAYVPEARKIVVSFVNVNYMAILFLGDSTILAASYIDVGGPQKAMVSASYNADRIYTCLDNYSITSIGLTSGLLIKTFTFSSIQKINDIAFSYDGLKAFVANGVDSSIFIIDAARDSIVKTIKLSGVPTEVTGDITGNYLYVIFKDDRLLSKIDINSGTEVASQATGNEPMGLFWSVDYHTIGLCHSSDRTLLLTDAGAMATAVISPTFVYGQILTDACYSANGYHIWALEANVTLTTDEPPPPGMLGLLYQPTGQFVGHFGIGIIPYKIAQSPDGKFLYILETLSRDIRVVRTDIMN